MSFRPNHNNVDNNNNNNTAPAAGPTPGGAGQFHGWTEKTDAFRREADEADRERGLLEERLRRARDGQLRARDELREASDALGRVDRRRELLRKERSRLRKVLVEERVALEKCAAEAKELSERQKQRKKDFLRASKELNDELAALNNKAEELRLRNMISVEALPVLTQHYDLLHRRQQQVRQQRSGGGVDADASTTTLTTTPKTTNKSKHADDGGYWPDTPAIRSLEDLHRSSSLLATQADRYAFERDRYDELRRALSRFRRRAAAAEKLRLPDCNGDSPSSSSAQVRYTWLVQTVPAV